MSAAHTPGPWQVGPEFLQDCGGFKLYGRPISGGGKAIARVWSGSERRLFELPEDEANARLIAAAPELLKALHEARETLYREHQATKSRRLVGTLHVIELAIAKATAEEPS